MCLEAKGQHDFKRARGEYFASLTKSDALPSIRVPGAERMRRIVESVTWREDKGETLWLEKLGRAKVIENVVGGKTKGRSWEEQR